jgi:hypothetical protein
MNKVAIGRVVLTNREHIIALDGVQDVENFRRRRVRRDALRRIPANCVKRALAGMRIGAVPASSRAHRTLGWRRPPAAK